MKDATREYLDLKADVERLGREGAVLEGEQAALLRKLREHGCGSLEKAAAMLKKLESDERKAAAEFQRELASFRAKWGDKL